MHFIYSTNLSACRCLEPTALIEISRDAENLVFFRLAILHAWIYNIYYSAHRRLCASVTVSCIAAQPAVRAAHGARF